MKRIDKPVRLPLKRESVRVLDKSDVKKIIGGTGTGRLDIVEPEVRC